MNLQIDTLTIRAHVRRHSRINVCELGYAIQSDFSERCRSLLKARLSAVSRVVRLKRLYLRIRLRNVLHMEEVISSILADTFVIELEKAIGSSNVELVRADSRPHWLAMVIRDWIAGTAPQKWEYHEFKHLFALSISNAILELLCAEPDALLDTLELLYDDHILTRIVALFDEVKLENMFGAIARRTGLIDQALSLEHFFAVSGVLTDLKEPIAYGQLKQRAQALSVYFVLRKKGPGRVTHFWSPRMVLHIIQSLSFLTTHIRTGVPLEWKAELTHLLQILPVQQSLDDSIVSALKDIQSLAQLNSVQFMKFLSVLIDLRAEENTTIDPANSNLGQWIASEYAGVFLLTGILVRLGWPQVIVQTTFGKLPGSRAVTYLLAAIGLAVVEKLASVSTTILDPGLTLFAGWRGDVDMRGLRDFLTWQDASPRRALLAALTSAGEGVMEFGESWNTTVEYLAGYLIQNFAGRVRGFKQSSRSFVVQRLLATKGRIALHDDKVVVTLEPNPFQVALHLSGVDDTVESVAWLSNRRVEFILRGL